jgi:hypothetical protein
MTLVALLLALLLGAVLWLRPNPGLRPREPVRPGGLEPLPSLPSGSGDSGSPSLTAPIQRAREAVEGEKAGQQNRDRILDSMP